MLRKAGTTPLSSSGISSIIVATGHPPGRVFANATVEALPRTVLDARPLRESLQCTKTILLRIKSTPARGPGPGAQQFPSPTEIRDAGHFAQGLCHIHLPTHPASRHAAPNLAAHRPCPPPAFRGSLAHRCPSGTTPPKVLDTGGRR